MKFLQNGQEENGSKMVIIRLTISGNLLGRMAATKKGAADGSAAPLVQPDRRD
jgi:hypothetical protein